MQLGGPCLGGQHELVMAGQCLLSDILTKWSIA